MSKIEARLAELGITLPEAPAPAANYTPFVQAGDLLFVSGQIPLQDGAMVVGKLGADADLEAGRAAARLCALALIAQAKAAAGGDLDRVARVVKLTGFVNATPEFGQQPQVINAASDLLAEVFGEKGVHSRSAVGAGSLPFGVMVEIEAIFQLG